MLRFLRMKRGLDEQGREKGNGGYKKETMK